MLCTTRFLSCRVLPCHVNMHSLVSFPLVELYLLLLPLQQQTLVHFLFVHDISPRFLVFLHHRNKCLQGLRHLSFTKTNPEAIHFGCHIASGKTIGRFDRYSVSAQEVSELKRRQRSLEADKGNDARVWTLPAKEIGVFLLDNLDQKRLVGTDDRNPVLQYRLGGPEDHQGLDLAGPPGAGRPKVLAVPKLFDHGGVLAHQPTEGKTAGAPRLGHRDAGDPSLGIGVGHCRDSIGVVVFEQAVHLVREDNDAVLPAQIDEGYLGLETHDDPPRVVGLVDHHVLCVFFDRFLDPCQIDLIPRRRLALEFGDAFAVESPFRRLDDRLVPRNKDDRVAILGKGLCRDLDRHLPAGKDQDVLLSDALPVKVANGFFQVVAPAIGRVHQGMILVVLEE
mmetsp:Transcript_21909/g.46217  ORF Transcript_21909/g.46217 Transcript_21909/m.46217 type:complete len:393 (-) Transcript_21909:146-1324(-)